MATHDPMGVLPVLKPVGPTSHDVVARARRWFPRSAVGHLGTLDPAAGGLLLLAVGGATRAARFLEPPDTPKHYRAWVVFGAETDSDDAEGRLVAQTGATGLDRASLEAVVRARTGRQMQVPPSRSAVRVAGRHAYERARAGETVTPAAREVMVEAARVLAFSAASGSRPLARAVLECTLWRGGYVRAWARDLGRDLGMGAYVQVLVRGRIGQVHGHDALTLDEAGSEAEAGRLADRLWPVDRWLGAWPAWHEAADPGGRRLGRGLPAPSGLDGWVRLVGRDGAAWALARAGDGRWLEVVRLAGGGEAKA